LSLCHAACVLTGPAQHHKLIVWPTNRLPNLCLPPHDILCWHQRAALRYHRRLAEFRSH